MGINDGVNSATLIGEVSDPPRFHETQGGGVCRVTLKTIDTNAKQNKTYSTFHKVTIWGDRGAEVNNEVRVGMRLYVQGPIRNGSYVNSNGETKPTSEIIAKEVKIVDRSTTGNNNGGGYQNNTGNNNGGGGFNSGPIPF